MKIKKGKKQKKIGYFGTKQIDVNGLGSSLLAYMWTSIKCDNFMEMILTKKEGNSSCYSSIHLVPLLH